MADSAAPSSSRPVPRRRPEGEPRRRRQAAATQAVPLRRRVLTGLFVFVGVVLLVDGLVGDRGFLETLRAREAARTESIRLEGLRRENAELRESVRLLREDPATIEAEARRQLGLIRRGELLFIVKPARPADSGTAAGR
jgi:cell division protein FtsB